MHLDALRQAEVLRALSERTRSLVIVSDTRDCIEWVNEPFCRHTGYALADVVGRPVDELLNGPDTAREVRDALALARAEGRPTSAEILHYRQSGEQYWALVEGAPIHDAAGRPAGASPRTESDSSSARGTLKPAPIV
jgi:PAS domain S-box-containing protein